MKPGIQVEFTEVSSSDVETLADIRVAAMRESLEAVGRFNEGRSRARLVNGLDLTTARFIRVSGKKVGFFVLREQVGILFLDHLYVIPEFQNRGVGSATLARIFRIAERSGKLIRLGAVKGSRSNAFYRRHGFVCEASAEWDNYYVWRPHASDRASFT